MNSLLQRLGRTSFRHRRVVLAVWVGLFVAVAALAGMAGGSFDSNFSIPGTESQNATNLLAKHMPSTTAAAGEIVFGAPNGQKLTGHNRQTVLATDTEIAHSPGIASVSDPFTAGTVSSDGRVAYAQIRFDKPQASLTNTDRQPVATAAAHARAAGLQVGINGSAVAPASSGGATEGIGILIALLVLIITFGSLVTAGLPLLTSVIGVGIGLAGIVALSAVTSLSSATVSLAAMLGLAVGIDYALFITTRYRALARESDSWEAAAGQAISTAGTSIVFAGTTVVIALAALVVTGVPFLSAMGLAAAGTVAIAVIIALTLVPALLGFAGPRALKGKPADLNRQSPTMGSRWIGLVTRHRIAAVVLVTSATLGLAIPATHLRLGLPDDASNPPGTPLRIANDLLTQGFGPGTDGPLTLVVTIPPAANATTTTTAITHRLRTLNDVAKIAPARLTPDHSVAVVTVTPASGPSSTATTNLVNTIRNDRQTLTAGTHANLSVTGTTALNIDVANTMSSAMLPYLALIVVLAFLVLAIAFQSLLIPLIAVGGFLLSIAATLGALVAVFQDGTAASLLGVNQSAPIVSLIPILMIGILFGLAMDYQVFLVSGMREAHNHGADAQDAVHIGFRQSARVVTAAGLIMIGVFAGFILPTDPTIKSIGFALTTGVLIDAFLIRMTLIPALMSLLGQRAWWLPRPLQQIIPHIDLEGTTPQPQTPEPLPQAA